MLSPAKGRLYNVSCPGAGRELEGGTVFSATGPAGGGVDVQALAQRAVENLRLEGADIGIAPKPSGVGVVGMPVWIWNKPGPTRTGPATASASAGGVTVTARAKVRKVVYGMGDGSDPVVCTAPGTPYAAEYGKRMSPDCGHRYTAPSSTVDGGRYRVTATTTWDVEWAGAGQTGTITTTRDASTSVEIREVQVLN
ncbi:ATP/GTP-binding protein [Streptomyces sp. NPDC056231]|uniref:ATP/GTP-binding protein n=1 Tax=Streptomyces sp. NPDC056231 TaxID=3345755 RepID=UPI003AAC015E